jgi:hypothetical protein
MGNDELAADDIEVVGLDIRRMTHPFMTADDVSFFLGIPDREVVYKRARTGSLPEPLLASGVPFRPTMARLFRALDIAPMLEGDSRVLFAAWQRDEWQLPPFNAKDGREGRRAAERQARASLRPDGQVDRSS